MEYSGFQVCKGAGVSLSEQLADHFRKMILGHRIASGSALPSASSIRNASRLTVLHAYRILQSEGLVRMKSHHGTIVTHNGASGFFGLVICDTILSSGGNSYANQLLATIIKQGIFGSSPPKIYIIKDPRGAGGSIDPWIPNELRSDVQAGIIRGAFTFSEVLLPGLNKWLTDRNIPCVSAGYHPPASELEYRVDSDRDAMLMDLLNHPMVIKAGAIEVWSGMTKPDFLEGGRQIEIRWKNIRISDLLVSESGREAAKSIASEKTSREKVVFFEDDWLAISAVLELRRLGLRVPEDVHVIVATNSGMTERMLADCDRYVIDLVGLGGLMITMLTKAASGAAPSEKTKKIKYQFISGRKVNEN